MTGFEHHTTISLDKIFIPFCVIDAEEAEKGAASIKYSITRAMANLWGTVDGSVAFDMVHYNSSEQRGILAVHQTDAHKVMAAISITPSLRPGLAGPFLTDISYPVIDHA